MITCPNCKFTDWACQYRCPIDPGNDVFVCNHCGHRFKRYDPPMKRHKTDRELGEMASYIERAGDLSDLEKLKLALELLAGTGCRPEVAAYIREAIAEKGAQS